MASALPFIFFLISFICVANRAVYSQDGVICEESFCRNYQFEEGCSNPMTSCASGTGLWLPSPTMCNCCNYCIPLYAEGEACSPGGSGDGLTVGRCGPGLTCTEGICQRMQSECHSKQDDFDKRLQEGNVGFLEERPECDEKGNYAPLSCTKTQSCFCQSEDGERIFGEAVYRNPHIKYTMMCGCSRRHSKVSKNIGQLLSYPTVGPICSEDGSFEPVQCLNQKCFCVDEITGEIDTSSSIELNVQDISRLPCYKESEIIITGTEAPYTYTTECLNYRDWMISKVKDSEEIGFNIDYYTSVSNCLADGSYTRVKTEDNGTKKCVDAKGNQIENYEILPTEVLYDSTDCKCAQTRMIMEGLSERPVCCKNGNFREIQCRRGFCYCVDSDGKQVTREAENIMDLPCYKEDWLAC